MPGRTNPSPYPVSEKNLGHFGVTQNSRLGIETLFGHTRELGTNGAHGYTSNM